MHCQTPSFGGGFRRRPKRSVRCRRAQLVNRSVRGFTFAHTTCVLLEVIMDVRLVIEPHASEALKEVVREGLALHNVAATGAAEYYPVCLFLKNEHQEVLGGLLGVSGRSACTSPFSGSPLFSAVTGTGPPSCTPLSDWQSSARVP